MASPYSSWLVLHGYCVFCKRLGHPLAIKRCESPSRRGGWKSAQSFNQLLHLARTREERMASTPRLRCTRVGLFGPCWRALSALRASTTVTRNRCTARISSLPLVNRATVRRCMCSGLVGLWRMRQACLVCCVHSTRLSRVPIHFLFLHSMVVQECIEHHRSGLQQPGQRKRRSHRVSELAT